MSKELYQYRKENGLCTSCGDRAEPGKSRCIGCAQIEAVKNRMRYENLSQEAKREKRAYQKEYRKNHPVDKDKRSEYNRRYREKNPKSTFAYKERWFDFDGQKMRLPDIAKRTGIPYGRLYHRLFRERITLREAIARG